MKTAVEWLESEMLEHYSPFDNKLLYKVIHKAKEMEKDRTQEYAEFAIRCDRAGLPIILFKDWLTPVK